MFYQNVRSQRILEDANQYAEVLPLVKDLMQVDPGSADRIASVIKKRFGSQLSPMIFEFPLDVDGQLEKLRKCDVETQYHCMDFLVHLVMNKDLDKGLISAVHWSRLEDYMKGLNGYVVGRIRQCYGPLAENWRDNSTFVHTYAKSQFGLKTDATEEEVRKVYRTYLIRYYRSSKKPTEKSRQMMEDKMDAYCDLFGMSRFKQSVLEDSVVTESVRYHKYFIGCLFVSLFSILLLLVMNSWLSLNWKVVLYMAFLIGLCSAIGFVGNIQEVVPEFINVSVATLKKRKKRLLSDQGDVIPLIVYVCQLNPDAKSSQVRILKEIYSEQIEAFLENKVTYQDVFEVIPKVRGGREFKEKREVVDLLFKLAVADDGIKNDEWYFLNSLLSTWKFSDTFVNYYINRYGSLRTEFDEPNGHSSDCASGSSASRYLGNYYRTLGLEENASDEEVKRAYHALALQHHPDLPKNAGRKVECEALMAKINEAYEKICG
ncbi:MAG: J domain-containing protein [Paludibacteraceae bacterium]|nr:J domain-containing protein [Paludibacteraceae bacterium]